MPNEKVEPADKTLNGFWHGFWLQLSKAPKPLLYGAIAFIVVCVGVGVGVGLVRSIGGEWPWQGRVPPSANAASPSSSDKTPPPSSASPPAQAQSPTQGSPPSKSESDATHKKTPSTDTSKAKAKDVSPAVPTGPPPTYQQECHDSACAQGEGSQATYNQFGAKKLQMTPTTESKIVSAMTQFIGQSVEIDCQTSTEPFVDSLARALRAAGMNVKQFPCSNIIAEGNDNLSGISVVAGDRCVASAMQLIVKLHELGLVDESKRIFQDFDHPNVCAIVVRPNQ